MTAVGLLNVKKNPSDVNGHSADTIVATTFVELGKKSYVLFVMAAGNHAEQLCKQLGDKLANVKFL